MVWKTNGFMTIRVTTALFNFLGLVTKLFI